MGWRGTFEMGRREDAVAVVPVGVHGVDLCLQLRDRSLAAAPANATIAGSMKRGDGT
jgi:hypothetical protein